MTEDQNRQAEQWSKKAHEHLATHELPPTPENYAIFFSYASGSNPNLIMSVDLLVEKFSKLTSEQCADLYQSHLSVDAEKRMLASTTTSVEEELKRIMDSLNNTAGDHKRYGETLNRVSGTLRDAVSLDSIRSAIEKVAKETHVMAVQNERLQAQLEQSTQQLSEAKYKLDEVRKESMIDPLTEVGNRKFFNTELARTVAECKENKTTLSLLVCDIDHFKKFNDTYGHLIGDQVLRLVAKTLVENLKGRDIIARYGGEEFVILLSNTQIKDAVRIGDQLRQGLSTKQLKRKNSSETLGSITISIGATEYASPEDLDAFIHRADEALYEAKQTGRNRVVSRLFGEEPSAASGA